MYVLVVVSLLSSSLKFLNSSLLVPKILAGDTNAFIATGGYDWRHVILAFDQEQQLETVFMVSDEFYGSHLYFHSIKVGQCFFLCVLWRGANCVLKLYFFVSVACT
jgi:hypothetical protein